MVQYLSLKEQKKKFRIYHQTSFLENQPVEFDAELYNDNYELINSPDIGITILNEEGRQFQFVFNKAGNAYHLNCGSFPPGDYSYTAKVTDNSLYQPESGQFSVSALDIESLNTIADHNVLYQLAGENQGAMYSRDQLDDLKEEILNREDIRPVTYTRKSYEDLINKWWVAALVIGFLTLEWFLRKRAGGY
jgi:VCBS repeat-containing protein